MLPQTLPPRSSGPSGGKLQEDSIQKLFVFNKSPEVRRQISKLFQPEFCDQTQHTRIQWNPHTSQIVSCIFVGHPSLGFRGKSQSFGVFFTDQTRLKWLAIAAGFEPATQGVEIRRRRDDINALAAPCRGAKGGDAVESPIRREHNALCHRWKPLPDRERCDAPVCISFRTR
jgi:hypothetical protein